MVVQYKYDSWGKVLSTTGSLASTLGTLQPFRYRGYVYDVETRFYYLKDRYYDSIITRFINADRQINSGMLVDNQFSYCSNNPINRSDSNGCSWINDAINWIGDTLVKPIGNLVNGMIDTYKQTKSTNARLTQAVARKVIIDIDNTIKVVKNWWNRKAKPWLNRILTKTRQLINKAIDFVKKAWYTQVEMNNRIMQVKLDATMRIGGWVANNWINVMDGITTGISGVYAIYSLLPWVGVAVPPLSLPLNLIGFFAFAGQLEELSILIYS